MRHALRSSRPADHPVACAFSGRALRRQRRSPGFAPAPPPPIVGTAPPPPMVGAAPPPVAHSAPGPVARAAFIPPKGRDADRRRSTDRARGSTNWCWRYTRREHACTAGCAQWCACFSAGQRHRVGCSASDAAASSRRARAPRCAGCSGQHTNGTGASHAFSSGPRGRLPFRDVARAYTSLETVAFSGQRSRALTYGQASIRIPEDHKIGDINASSSWKLFLGITLSEEKLDEQEHFTVRSLKTFTLDEWDQAIRTRNPKSALIFVHGYNTSFEAALYRNAQIVWDLRYEGLSVLYSWASWGGTTDYLYDRESAQIGRAGFIEVLRNLKERHGIESVNVIAHSMGNQVVLDALGSYAQTSNPATIGELILAAPDVDRDMFDESHSQCAEDRERHHALRLVGRQGAAGLTPSCRCAARRRYRGRWPDRARQHANHRCDCDGRGDTRPQPQCIRRLPQSDRRHQASDHARGAATRPAPVADSTLS